MTKENENYREMKRIFNEIMNCDLHEKKGGKFHFTFYTNDKINVTDIDALDLSARAFHGLKRAGYDTIGQLVESLSNGTDLRQVRNCGARSYAEIMEKLFIYNLTVLPGERRIQYLSDTVQKNEK